MMCVFIFHKMFSSINEVFTPKYFLDANSKKKCRFACFNSIKFI